MIVWNIIFNQVKMFLKVDNLSKEKIKDKNYLKGEILVRDLCKKLPNEIKR